MGKVNVNYYLSEELTEQIEDLSIEMRRKFKTRKINKSLVVEKAVTMAIEDYLKNGDKSRIAKQFAAEEGRGGLKND